MRTRIFELVLHGAGVAVQLPRLQSRKKSGGRWVRRSVEQISNSIYSAKPKQNGQDIFPLLIKALNNIVE